MEEYISHDNPVRFIDAFVDELDLQAVGFQRTQSVAGADLTSPEVDLGGIPALGWQGGSARGHWAAYRKTL